MTRRWPGVVWIGVMATIVAAYVGCSDAVGPRAALNEVDSGSDGTEGQGGGTGDDAGMGGQDGEVTSADGGDVPDTMAMSDGSMADVEADGSSSEDTFAEEDTSLVESDAPDGEDDVPDAVNEGDTADNGPTCVGDWTTRFEEPSPIALGRPFDTPMALCQVSQRFMVLASGMELTLSLSELPEASVVEIVSMTGTVLMSGLAEEGQVEMTFSPPTSGEWRVRVYRVTGVEQGRWRGALTCQAGCDRETTRYPIVLVHGLAGTDNYFGILDYWYQIPEFLEERGYRIYITVSDFIGHSERRAPQIAEQIDAVLEDTGAGRVHLIGHSQGGLDMRVLVGGLGYDDRTASMTTVVTPHQGLKIELPEFLTGMDFGESYLTGEFIEMYPDV